MENLFSMYNKNSELSTPADCRSAMPVIALVLMIGIFCIELIYLYLTVINVPFWVTRSFGLYAGGGIALIALILTAFKRHKNKGFVFDLTQAYLLFPLSFGTVLAVLVMF